MAENPVGGGEGGRGRQQQPRLRRFNPVETGIDLLINLFESFSEDMEKKAGWDVSGLGALGAGARARVLEFLSANRSLLPFLETGMKVAVFAAIPGLSPESKTAVNSLLDLYTDGIRKAMAEKDDDKSEALVATASANFKSAMSKLLDETAKQRKAKPRFDSLVDELDPIAFEEYAQWTAWMSAHPQPALEKWNGLRDQIPSVSMLKRLLEIADGEDMETKTNARMAFLASMYSRNPSLTDTAKKTAYAVLRGESTPQTHAIEQYAQNVHSRLRQNARHMKTRNKNERKRYGF
jgi:hypothetical protein